MLPRAGGFAVDAVPALRLETIGTRRSQPLTAARLLLDVSSLVRWLGPPTGMIRVEQELANVARGQPGITPVVFDKAVGGYRGLRPQWAELILGPSATLDPGVAPRRGWRR